MAGRAVPDASEDDGEGEAGEAEVVEVMPEGALVDQEVLVHDSHTCPSETHTCVFYSRDMSVCLSPSIFGCLCLSLTSVGISVCVCLCLLVSVAVCLHTYVT